jgi:hypothetical protein
MARFTIATFSVLTAPSRCGTASLGSCGSNLSPTMELRGPTAGGGGGGGGGELQNPGQESAHAGEAIAAGQIGSFSVSDQTMINQRQPIPNALEPVPQCQLGSVIELIKLTAVNLFDHLGERRIKSVQGRIQR